MTKWQGKEHTMASDVTENGQTILKNKKASRTNVWKEKKKIKCKRLWHRVSTEMKRICTDYCSPEGTARIQVIYSIKIYNFHWF